MKKQTGFGHHHPFLGMFKFSALTLTVFLAGVAGANERLVLPGDLVDLHFTCRLKNGEIAISTLQSVSSNPALPKSWIYIPRDRSTPLRITAGKNPTDLEQDSERGFEGEILYQLTKMAVGHRDGNTQTHEVNAEKMPEKQEGMYLIKISRVRQRDKEMRFTPEEYKAKTGAVPEVGRRFIFDPALPGKLESVDENEVVVRFGPEPGVEILTPFGKGILRDGGDKWEIVIDARKGDLVRSGALIGKIIEVDDREITIDYSHPFGGETLLCDVEIDLVSKEETATGKQTEFPESGKTNLPTGSPLQTAGKGGRNGGLQEIKKGDVVSVNYTATLEDGSLLFTTYAELAKDQSRRKAPQYKEPKTFGPEEIVAGTSTKVPGIADAVIGMTPGARKQLSLPPETAYGPIDQAKIQTLPTIRSVPRKLSMSPEQFYEQFRVFPMQGRDVQLTPFLTARISEVTPDSAHLELTAKDGEEAEVEYGKVRIRSAADQVIVQLIPKIGTTFKSNTNEGRITRADGETFVVDFNSPLAGRTIGLDVEVVSVSPIPEIAWSEDHDEELRHARKAGKPSIVVLYADWCSWSKKLFNESFLDPGIRLLRDRLVWIKVNSDKKVEYKQKYQQSGFPMILLFQGDGEVFRKIDGYVDAKALREAIEALVVKKSSQES